MMIKANCLDKILNSALDIQKVREKEIYYGIYKINTR